MKKEKIKQKGITLISLIITIILLLILAGIVINLALGKDGILRYAEIAGERFENKAKQETNELEKVYYEMEGIVANRGSYTTSEDYFFFSKNGFNDTLAKSQLNSLFGLTATTYETVEGDEFQCNKLEKSYHKDLSGEFEIVVKNRLAINDATQMGGVTVTFNMLNEDGTFKPIADIRISDDWQSETAIQRWIKYNDNIIFNDKQNSSTDYVEWAIVGNGTNIKFYANEQLLQTIPQESGLAIDNIEISFQKYPTRNQPYLNYLEKLYIGPIKYYKDIIN